MAAEVRAAGLVLMVGVDTDGDTTDEAVEVVGDDLSLINGSVGDEAAGFAGAGIFGGDDAAAAEPAESALEVEGAVVEVAGTA